MTKAGRRGGGPPGWSEALLSLALPAEERTGVLGDLREEWERLASTGDRSASARWYRREALRLSLRFLAERVREQRPSGDFNTIGDGPGGSARGGVMGMTGWLMDARASFRSLLRKPGFLGLAGLTLALGIGANTAIFSVIYSSLLAPLPVPDADGLVWLSDRRFEGGLGNSSTTANLVDIDERARTIDEVGIYQALSMNLSEPDSPAERVEGLSVSPEFLAALRVPFTAGRNFSAEENVTGAPPLAVISNGIWRRRFGSDPGLVGRTIQINAEPHTVIGILSSDVELFGDPQIFVAFRWDPANLSRGSRGVNAVARLQGAATVEMATFELESIMDDLREDFPGSNDGWTAGAMPIRDLVVGRETRRQLNLLLGAAALVLIIACVNVMNLLLARAETRSREIAVRAAMGAGRSRLATLFLSEGLIVASVGAVVGIAGAAIGLPALDRLFSDGLRGTSTASISWPVLGFALGVAAISGLLVGLTPVLTTSLKNLQETLREGGRGATGSGSTVRRGLVILEVALAMTLVAGAGLLLKSFWALSSIDLGVEDAEQVLIFEVALPSAAYPEGDAVREYFRTLTDRLGNLAAVEAASVTNRLPFNAGTNVTEVHLADNPERTAGFMELRTVTKDFFQAAGIQIVRGRGLQEGDAATGSGFVVITSQLADELTDEGEEIIGRQIEVWEGFTPTVVGVAADIRDRGPTRQPPPGMYFDLGGPFQPGHLYVIMRVTGDPLAVMPAAREAVAAIDPTIAAFGPRLLSDVARQVVGRGRSTSLSLVVLFGLVALLLGAVGIYGVMSYFVTQRTREMGIRIALGARRGTVTSMVIRQGIRMTAVGIIVGFVGAFFTSRLLESLLWQTSPMDIWTHGAVALLLGGVAVLATWVPAARAARIDPMQAFREE